MPSEILINLDDLLNCRSVERSRLEFKEGWDDQIKENVVRTVSAFANDLLNLNGGYIILGIKTDERGNPILPPQGMDDYDLDRIQREIIGECKGKISPEYIPQVFPETYLDKCILIIWVPGGDNRPYDAPKRGGHGGKAYHVRSGSATIEATGDILRQLIEQTAKIPFDDRRSLTGKTEDISPVLVKKFLEDVRSYFSRDVIANINQIYRDMKLVVPVNSHEVPKNVALLFFNDDPEEFFNGAHIEVVQFGDDEGDLIEEKEFRGPLNQQIKSCLNYLNSLGGTLLQKVPGQAEVEKTVPYPYEAMEEAIVNAVYHRSYESSSEPIKVYLYPDRMEIISYPGPVAGIQLKHFEPGQSIPQVPARNRRIGELLKELRLAEGRGTGIPKIRRRMQENGSPQAKFDFDDTRTYFRVTLPVHPKYRILHTLRTASHLWAIGEKEQAFSHLNRAITNQPGSGILISQFIEYAFALDKVEVACKAFKQFEKETVKTEPLQPSLTLARLFIDKNQSEKANSILAKIPASRTLNETIEAAILKKRSGDLKGAHHLFAEAYSLNQNDPKLIQEFSQTKNKLASKLWRREDLPIKKKLNKEAVELLRRAIQLSDDSVRTAWCWFDLARCLNWLREPQSEIEEAFLKAISLLPDERRFREEYTLWRDRSRK